MSWERVLRADGNEPDRDREARLMEMTRLDWSQLMPFQLQKKVLEDQPEGVGDRAFKSSDITAASSAMAMVERREKMSIERETRRPKSAWDMSLTLYSRPLVVFSTSKAMSEGDRKGKGID